MPILTKKHDPRSLGLFKKNETALEPECDGKGCGNWSGTRYNH